jgi:hypothetical protein
MLEIGQVKTKLNHERRNVTLSKELNESHGTKREREGGEREMAIVYRTVL